MTARKLTIRPAITPSATVTNATSRGTYAGLELKPYAGRPGAMDAFKLPSRIGIHLIPPRAAMGFLANYLLPDNQRAAMHMLGNAVCPPVARDVLNAIKEAA